MWLGEQSFALSVYNVTFHSVSEVPFFIHSPSTFINELLSIGEELYVAIAVFVKFTDHIPYVKPLTLESEKFKKVSLLELRFRELLTACVVHHVAGGTVGVQSFGVDLTTTFVNEGIILIRNYFGFSILMVVEVTDEGVGVEVMLFEAVRSWEVVRFRVQVSWREH